VTNSWESQTESHRRSVVKGISEMNMNELQLEVFRLRDELISAEHERSILASENFELQMKLRSHEMLLAQLSALEMQVDALEHQLFLRDNDKTV